MCGGILKAEIGIMVGLHVSDMLRMGILIDVPEWSSLKSVKEKDPQEHVKQISAGPGLEVTNSVTYI